MQAHEDRPYGRSATPYYQLWRRPGGASCATCGLAPNRHFKDAGVAWGSRHLERVVL